MHFIKLQHYQFSKYYSRLKGYVSCTLILYLLALYLCSNAACATGLLPSEHVVVSFPGNDGQTPTTGLVSDSEGNLYGTTTGGGIGGNSIIFVIPKNLSSNTGYGPLQIIHFFKGTDGMESESNLIIDAQGNLYGTTRYGGINSEGTLFKLPKDSLSPTGYGSLQSLYSFTSLQGSTFKNFDGAEPASPLLLDDEGNLLGTTSVGGSDGFGVVFKLSTNLRTSTGFDNYLVVLHNFKNASGPNKDGAYITAGLISDSQGNLFGASSSGGLVSLNRGFGGVLFKIPKETQSPTRYGPLQTLYVFSTPNSRGTNAEGFGVVGALVFDKNGTLYGTPSGGGIYGKGTVIKLSKDNQSPTGYGSAVQVLHSFNGTNGATPFASLYRSENEDLFGVTVEGGQYNNGVLFKIPYNNTSHTGYGPLQVLHVFSALNSNNLNQDGVYPQGSLIEDNVGNLLSTNSGGGLGGYGTVFKLLNDSNSPTGFGKLETLHDFAAASNQGYNPQSRLLIDKAGNLLGTTPCGGSSATAAGTIFKIAPDAAGTYLNSALSSLYSFQKALSTQNPNGGAYPQAGFVSDSKGNLFSTTLYGGQFGYGSIFELPMTRASSGSISYGVPVILYSFTALSSINNNIEGANPQGGLTLDSQDNLYGTTLYGGQFSNGTVFMLPKDNEGSSTTNGYGAIKTLYSFTNFNNDGANSQASLFIDTAGNLFGTNYLLGKFGYGTVFDLLKNSQSSTGYDPAQTLYSFTDQLSDGAFPQTDLVADSNGNLFGTTAFAGQFGYGVIFEIPRISSLPLSYGALQILHSFSKQDANGANADGVRPLAGLLIDTKGNLFGTTEYGGAFAVGTVFKLPIILDAEGNSTFKYGPLETLYNFKAGNIGDSAADGGNPIAPLINDSKGNLFGTTNTGGIDGRGTVFEIQNAGFVVPTPTPLPSLVPTISVIAQGKRFMISRVGGDTGQSLKVRFKIRVKREVSINGVMTTENVVTHRHLIFEPAQTSQLLRLRNIKAQAQGKEKVICKLKPSKTTPANYLNDSMQERAFFHLN